MIILDYVRKMTERSEIVIPPFHTGHLGFVPETEVHLGLLGDFQKEVSHYELLVAPFKLAHTHLTHLGCTMRDQPGVVKRLVDAVSSLNINISTQESSSLHRSKYHRVNLILDWSTTTYDVNQLSSKRDQDRYRRFLPNFPTHLHFYILLFEAVIKGCGEVIVSERIGGEHLPALFIRPMNTPIHLPKEFMRVDTARLERLREGPTRPAQRRADRSFRTRLRIPQEMIHIVERRFGRRPHYILASETETRVLHVFFPTPDVVDRLLHVAFSHEDLPGALSTLLELIRDADFNIVASLLRQNTDQRNTWEAILEYRKKEPHLPSACSYKQHSPRDLGKHACEWVGERLASVASRCSQDVRDLLCTTYDIQLHPPSYPRPSVAHQDFRLILKELIERSAETSTRRGKSRSKAIATINHQAGHRLSPENLEQDESRFIRDIQTIVAGAQAARVRPKVFLSYPREAQWIVNRVRQRFDNEFELRDYFDRDNQKITDEVIRRIRDCDVFVAFWHPDYESRRVKGDPKLSPWLPFEFGVAKAQGKDTMRCRYTRLPSDTCRKIEGEIALAEYDEKNYEDCLNQIGNFLSQFLSEHPKRS